MSGPISDREANSVLSRLRGHARNAKLAVWLAEDCQEAADLIERLQRRIAKLETDVEAAYAETDIKEGKA